MIWGMNPRGKSTGVYSRPGGHNAANSKVSPGAICRYLFSCGYEVVGQARKAGGWFRAEVKDRKTGEARGIRWVRPRQGERSGYEVRSTDPDPKVRSLDSRRKCPTCGGPLVTLEQDEEVPGDVCSQTVGGSPLLPGVLCVTVAQQMLEEIP
jgi:hypothetical protein